MTLREEVADIITGGGCDAEHYPEALERADEIIGLLREKSAEREALESSLSLMRRFYCDSEITEKGDMKILQRKYPDMMKDLVSQMDKLTSVISGT